MDGQWIAFGSTATNLNAAGYEPNEFQQVFRRRLFEFETYTAEGHPSGPYKTDVDTDGMGLRLFRPSPR